MSDFPCIPNIGFFGSIAFLESSLTFVAIFTTPIQIFGLWCIVSRSKDDLTSAKWTLLHVHVATSIFNVTITLLSVPYLLLPGIGGIANGFLTKNGFGFEVPVKVQFYLLMVELALMALSNLSMIESRFSLLFVKPEQFWRKVRRPWMTIHYFKVLGLLVLAIRTLPDQSEARELVFKTLPCLPKNVYDSVNVFILTVNFSILIVTFTIFILIIISEIVFLGMLFLLFSAEQVQSCSISRRQFTDQITFFFKLVGHVAIPLISLIIPLIYATYSVFFNYFNPVLNNFLVVIMASSHGAASSMVMIVVHGSYRKALISIISPRNQRALDPGRGGMRSRRRRRSAQVSVQVL